MASPVTPYDKYARGNMALLFALIFCVTGAVVLVVAAVLWLIDGELLWALVYAPLALLFDVALVVTFHRVRALGTASPPGPAKPTKS